MGDRSLMKCAAPSELDVERSIRERLYGKRSAVDRVEAPAVGGPRGTVVPGTRLAGRYRVIERIGTGGMATVHRARDERLGRAVAVKVIDERLARDPRSLRRFRREAEVCASLAHPNIVAILDAASDPREFIVMELVAGGDARALLRDHGRLAAAEAVAVLAQVCEALGYAHGRGVVHRDVTPSNILVDRAGGTAKLADFGISSDARTGAIRPNGRILGTPGYVAPEILRGGRASPASDLYSLGVVAHRLLSGTRQGRPVPGNTTVAHAAPVRCAASLADERPDLPCELLDAVEQAIAHDPRARQRSVAEFRAQLVASGAPTRLHMVTARAGSVDPPALHSAA